MHSPAINAFVALRYLSAAASSKLPSISVVQTFHRSGRCTPFPKGPHVFHWHQPVHLHVHVVFLHHHGAVFVPHCTPQTTRHSCRLCRRRSNCRRCFRAVVVRTRVARLACRTFYSQLWPTFLPHQRHLFREEPSLLVIFRNTDLFIFAEIVQRVPFLHFACPGSTKAPV